MIEEACDKRKEYADKIRALADTIETSPHQPMGLYVLYTNDNPLNQFLCMEKQEPGFNQFQFIGALQDASTRVIVDRLVHGR